MTAVRFRFLLLSFFFFYYAKHLSNGVQNLRPIVYPSRALYLHEIMRLLFDCPLRKSVWMIFAVLEAGLNVVVNEWNSKKLVTIMVYAIKNSKG